MLKELKPDAGLLQLQLSVGRLKAAVFPLLPPQGPDQRMPRRNSSTVVLTRSMASRTRRKRRPLSAR